MWRIVLVCSEPIRRRMAGIGIRYLRLAEELSKQLGDSYRVELLSPAPEDPSDGLSADGGDSSFGSEFRLVAIEPERFAQQLAGARCVIAQGQLANDVLIQCRDLPTVIDLYDPWLIEHLHYFESMGLDPYRNDHATWLLQLSRGDYFLCSSREQRLFYLGFLTAVGRVNPHSVEGDPELAERIGIVPFGIDPASEQHHPYLDTPESPRRRLLFGGLYDWYDPATTLQALELLFERSSSDDVELLFIRSPNPGNTPQRRLQEVEAWQKAATPRLSSAVRFLDWVPYERRFDLLADVDLLVSTHLPGLETDLSLRTRFLEALASRCPVVVTEGGALGRHIERTDSGWLVPARDPSALCAAFEQVLAGGDFVDGRLDRGQALADEFAWSRVVTPLVRFCRNPGKDEAAQDFAATLGSRAPADTTGFRIRRRLKLLLGGAQRSR